MPKPVPFLLLTLLAVHLHIVHLSGAEGPADPIADRIGLPDVKAATGAQIVETYTVEMYVSPDGQDGSDGRDPQHPLRTVRAAITAAMPALAAGQATRIHLAAGIYRDAPGAVDFGAGKKTLLAIVGSGPGEVIMSGADPIQMVPDARTGILIATWPQRFGNSYYDWPVEPVGHRCEMAFIDGKPLVQKVLETAVMDERHQLGPVTGLLDPATILTPGTFGVVEMAENAECLYVRLPTGAKGGPQTVTATVRHTWAQFGPKQGLVLRNLVFAHFANRCRYPWITESPLELAPATADLLLDNCTFRLNNAVGLSLGGASPSDDRFQRVTIRSCHFDDNGFGGLGSGRIVDALFEDCTSDRNGWRSWWCEDTGWAHAGMKMHNVDGVLLRRHQALGNIGQGIWFDVHCRNVVVDSLRAVHNTGSGLFTEISEGPFQIRRCLLAFNRGAQFGVYSVGACTVIDTILAGSATFQTKDQGLARFRFYPRPGNEQWEQHPFQPGQLLMHGVVSWTNGGMRLWNFSNNPASIPAFRTTYRGEENCWFAPDDTPVRFVFGDGDDAEAGDFSAWKTYMGAQEQNPHWLDPGFTAPELGDFTLRAESPLLPRVADLPAWRVDPHDLALAEAFWAWAGMVDDRSSKALVPDRGRP